ncbi:DUF4091 domain-containing protein [Labilibacter sediminis]|nr:DUF4091 domain-containing protein [Labilibacter sediminis]
MCVINNDMMNLFVKIFFLFCGVLLLTNCNSIDGHKNFKNNSSYDGLEDVPEWLKLNVEESLPFEGLSVWIPTNSFKSSALIRVPRFPRKYTEAELTANKALEDFKIVGLEAERLLKIEAVQNEQISAQLAMAAKVNLTNVNVELNELTNIEADVIDTENIQVRFVKYVPVQRSRSEYVWSPKMEEIIGEGVSGSQNPNVVADPLIQDSYISIPAFRAQPVWFTIHVPDKTKPGMYRGKVTISCDQFDDKSYAIELHVHDKKIPSPEDYKFHLDLWINPSAIASYYKMTPWSGAHWKMISKYLKDYASRGGKNIATTITHEPWHKPWINNSTRSQIEYGYESMVKWSKDLNGNWEFDYSIFDKYVELATEHGIKGAINAFSMTPFHTSQKIHYFDNKDNCDKVIELNIEDEKYKEVWSAFLLSFKEHLKKKGYFERTYLGFDEKPEDVLRSLQQLIENVAPEFLERIIIAGHPEAGVYANNLSISYMFFPGQLLEERAVVPVLPTIEERNSNKQITTFYLCAEPSHPNTLTYSPAIEGQMVAWLALKYNTDGYLRWAYNNWPKEPFENPVFMHTQGDDYYVYPGERGPISSIRWELLKEGIEDYELVRVIRDEEKLDQSIINNAIQIATHNQDGRYKMAEDMVIARGLLVGR